jgi:hypothetical protein
MARLLTTYALVKTLHDRGRDYVDAFSPLLVLILAERGESATLQTLQGAFNKRFSVDIPIHSLQAIATRAVRKGYARLSQRHYALLPAGTDAFHKLEPTDSIDRRINALVDEITVYLQAEGVEAVSSQAVADELTAFVYINIDSLVDYLSPSATVRPTTKPAGGKLAPYLAGYFALAKDRKPESYKLISEIVQGSVITAAASSDELVEITRKFSQITAFLDTNLVFSLLDLHHVEFSRPAKEMVGLLKKSGFQLRVFDFTLDEAVAVLSNYPPNMHLFPRNVRVSSVYSKMRQRGLSTVDLQELVATIDVQLLKLGIDVEHTGVPLTRRTYGDDVLAKIREYKPGKRDASLVHDLAAIDAIKLIRRTEKRLLEQCKAIFLTSDLRLARYDYDSGEHRSRRTVAEVIPDQLATNIVWLKNPTVGPLVPLSTAIALHGRGMLIDRSVWMSFYECLNELRSANAISDKDISLLFYNQYIERALRRFNDDGQSRVTREFVTDQIEKAREVHSAEVARTADARGEVVASEFSKKLTQERLDAQKRSLERATSFKKTAWEKAERRASKTVAGMLVLLNVAVVVCILLLTPLVLRHWAKIEPCVTWISICASVILAGLGDLLSARRLYGVLKEAVAKRIYRDLVDGFPLDASDPES